MARYLLSETEEEAGRVEELEGAVEGIGEGDGGYFDPSQLNSGTTGGLFIVRVVGIFTLSSLLRHDTLSSMQTVRYNHEKGNIPISLTNLPFFSKLKQSCLDEILNHASILQLDPGDAVVKEGECTGALYFLLSGGMEVIKSGATLARLKKAGELFGELSYISDDPHGATVRATTKSYVFKIDNSFQSSLPEKHLDHFESVLYRFLAKLLAARLKRASRSIVMTEDEPDIYVL